jgi:hypothetical protein
MDTPKFSQLPNLPGGPKGCSWAVWNDIHEKQIGIREKDKLGTLNHLTPSVVAAAANQIKTGDRVALKYVATAALKISSTQDMKLMYYEAGGWTPTPM